MSSVSLTRAFVICAAGFVCCGVLTTLIGGYVEYQHVAAGRKSTIFRAEVVQTPFTSTRGMLPAEFAAVTNLPIYPGAAATEMGLVGYSTALVKSGSKMDFTFMRLRANEVIESVDKWYEGKLGSSFERSEGPIAVIASGTDSRVFALLGQPEARGIVYRARRLGGEQGDEVILESDARRNTVVIDLVHYVR